MIGAQPADPGGFFLSGHGRDNCAFHLLCHLDQELADAAGRFRPIDFNTSPFIQRHAVWRFGNPRKSSLFDSE